MKKYLQLTIQIWPIVSNLMNMIAIQENSRTRLHEKTAGKPREVNIRLACVEDGLDNIGFRKIAAFIKSIHPNTKVAYVPTGNLRNLIRIIIEKGAGDLTEKDIYNVAKFLSEGNIVGLSSMTQYSTTVHKIIANIRKINPFAYIIWGGIHPIIHPEDAIKHADAFCTGE